MKERQELQETILLCGESDKERFKRTFHIVETVSAGASCICYEAYHENSGRGILKEFYPVEGHALKRNDDCQLVCADASSCGERFEKAMKEYIEPYVMLRGIRQKSSSQELAAFIPEFEIYFGCDVECNVVGTVYIWLPQPGLETFDKICDEIHMHPEQRPEHKLVTVLSAVETLARCICTLHGNGLVHRDIKPSNFGFVKSGDETLTQTLSMFDIDSVCSVYHIQDSVTGTEGYMEPETGYAPASNQTDIYAIGATLFQAVVITDETKAGQYLYQEEYYGRIKEFIDASALIQASEANAHPRLRKILAVILQKCLGERSHRYANCEALLEDLETALYYALPSDIAAKQRMGERWVLAEAEDSLDQNQERNSILSIQYHLYEHPLYSCVTEEETAVNVLVIGFGNYGQKFLDICLQAGQIGGRVLNVTVVSEDVTDKDLYLEERPMLAEFFNVDGSLKGQEDIYGNIVFEVTKFAKEDRRANEDILKNTVMCEHSDTHYVFVAMGDDGLNLTAAEACQSVVDDFAMMCTVSYVCEKRPSDQKDNGDLQPIYVKEPVNESARYAEIERMAFNVHLLWEKNLNVDFNEVRKEYKKPYNHHSCVSNVLSLKYWLYGIGIDLDQCGCEEAAKIFEEKGLCTEEVKNELIWLEHSRWVTEKLCMGWKQRALEQCMDGNTRDEGRKEHACILRSRKDQMLTDAYKKDSRFWDEASGKALKELDELDRMSVELHRMFAEQAKCVKKDNLLYGNRMELVRSLAEGNPKTAAAFQEWFVCLRDIWNGDAKKVWLCESLKNAFLSAADGLPIETRKALKGQIQAFGESFSPIIKSMEYWDYKQDDALMIEQAPFILTYMEAVYMAVPFLVGSNTEVFGNVSAATVANPARILYLCLLEKTEDIEILEKTIPSVMAYLERKRVRSEVEFVLAYMDEELLLQAGGQVLEKRIRELEPNRICQVSFIHDDTPGKLVSSMEEYLMSQHQDGRVLAIEKNQSDLSRILQGADFYGRHTSYEFDSECMKFRNMQGCSLFGYIPKKPYITVADIMVFRRSSGKIGSSPEFFDEHVRLWNKYNEDAEIWKGLCSVLKARTEKEDEIASFQRMDEWKKNNESWKYTYILPFVCRKNVAKVLEALKAEKIAEKASQVEGYTSDACKVEIVDKCNNKEKYDKMFANVYAFMVPDAVRTYLKAGALTIVFDNLAGSGVLQFDKPEKSETYNEQHSDKRSKKIKENIIKTENLMQFWADMGYIIHLNKERIDSDKSVTLKYTFTYATRQIKSLLTMEGKILEIYVCHRLKASGMFDDVVSNYEIDWQDQGIKNEFDCILTKGFRMIFIECKATKKIDQNYYYKLKTLAEEFGVNASIVLISDTQEIPHHDIAKENRLQRKRGKMLDVVTIWKPEEIKDIEVTMQRILDGTYVSKG